MDFIKIKKPTIMPFFKISLGYSVFYLSLMVLLPLSVLVIKSSSITLDKLLNILSDARVIAAFYVSIKSAFIAALINTIFGFILSWVLVRYSFYGKRIIDAMIDLPLVLPTAIAGIALSSLYSKDSLIGKMLDMIGIQVSYTPIGIIVALIFIGLPFTVRTIEPILQEFDQEIEEAATCLGSSRWQIFTKIILPTVSPAMLTGFIMSFARGLGEYGSVIFIAGNIPKISEIVPLLIYIKLEQYDFEGACVIAMIMLILSFTIMLFLNLMQKYSWWYNE
jgi:sulfate/thiosulfate transport system permease protein